MQFEGIKRVVRKLATQSAFREEFLRQPRDVLAGQGVSLEEQRALLRLHRRLSAVNATSNVGDGPLAWP